MIIVHYNKKIVNKLIGRAVLKTLLFLGVATAACDLKPSTIVLLFNSS